MGQNGRTIVRVKVRQRRHRDNLARVHVHQNSGSAFGVHQHHTARKNAFGRGLNGQVNRQLERSTAIRRITQVVVELALNPCNTHDFSRINTFAAKVRSTKDMACNWTVRIKAHFARPEQQSRFTDVKDFLHLFRADLTADPDKATVTREILEQALFVQFRENPRKFRGSHLWVDHVTRVRVNGIGVKVGRQNAALAVDDIGPHRQDRITAPRYLRFFG